MQTARTQDDDRSQPGAPSESSPADMPPRNRDTDLPPRKGETIEDADRGHRERPTPEPLDRRTD
jgi:hypothetical protein